MLVLDTLKTALEQDWFVAEGGSFPGSAEESGQRFAGAVVKWFSSAQAGIYPCSTAAARQGELAGSAASALQSGAAQGAGAALASAVAQYITGQVFGAGVAQPPAATAAAGAQIGAAFGDVELPQPQRAQAIAGALALIASSTLVVFQPPPTLPPAPVT